MDLCHVNVNSLTNSLTTKTNQAQSEYKHVLANILRSLFVARTPSEEARSPGRHSNVENAPRRRSITGEPAMPTSHIRRAILRTPLITRQSAASSACRPRPAGRSHYLVISRDGRKLVTRVRVMLPYNTTRAPIVNPPYSAQLGGSLYHAPKLHRGPCSSVGVRPRTDTQTNTHTDTQIDTQTRVTTIHFASSTTHAKCNKINKSEPRSGNLW